MILHLPRVSIQVERLTSLILKQVGQYVQPYNEDGLHFIRSAADDIFNTDHSVDTTPIQKVSRSTGLKSILRERSTLVRPKTFAHYVLNLPDSALTFLPVFVGLHTSRSAYFAENPDVKLPMIHAHCFNTKSDDNIKEEEAICKEISKQINYEMRPSKVEGELGDGEVNLHDVRDVAPGKRMFCASFRLPSKVAFAAPIPT